MDIKYKLIKIICTHKKEKTENKGTLIYINYGGYTMSTKPNHICKNINCKKGKDENGNPCQKHYYACDYCDRINNYKSLACSWECYVEYMEQILDARGTKQTFDTLYPNRTDMSQSDLYRLYNTPIEEIKKKTEEDLKPYLDKGLEITEAVEEINKEIDKEETKKNKSHK